MNYFQFLKKKRYAIPTVFIAFILILNLIKHPFVYYLPFDIPGKQMASTIPPFGIFIESKYQNENSNETLRRFIDQFLPNIIVNAIGSIDSKNTTSPLEIFVKI